jgi:DNA-binding NtrC family response regulator
MICHGIMPVMLSSVGANSPPAEGEVARFGRWRDKRKYTIFLVEDDSGDRNMMLHTLQRSPLVHNVHWFDSGDNMMNHFQHEEYYRDLLADPGGPLLVILDIRIPGTDGMGILKLLKDEKNTVDIPVIMMTGAPTEKLSAESYKLGAGACIAKPVDLERIHEVMLTGQSWPADLLQRYSHF